MQKQTEKKKSQARKGNQVKDAAAVGALKPIDFFFVLVFIVASAISPVGLLSCTSSTTVAAPSGVRLVSDVIVNFLLS